MVNGLRIGKLCSILRNVILPLQGHRYGSRKSTKEIDSKSKGYWLQNMYKRMWFNTTRDQDIERRSDRIFLISPLRTTKGLEDMKLFYLRRRVKYILKHYHFYIDE